MAAARDVVVFSCGGARHAVERRWVRDVVALGFVTSVPSAPPALGGVCNLHGAILPVLDLPALQGGPPGPLPRQGDAAIVVEAEGIVCALRVDGVEGADPEAAAAAAEDAAAAAAVIDPPRLVRAAIAQIAAAGAASGARP